MTARGRLEVVAGPMFAGKTEELLRRVRAARTDGRRVEVVTHVLDTRRGTGQVSTHTGAAVPARTVRDAADLAGAVTRAVGDGRPPVELLAVDEAHFFGDALVDVVQRIADVGVVVVVAGLSVTFDARPFPPLPELASLAERVDHLTAACAVCGADAAFHVRLVPDGLPDAVVDDPPLAPGDALAPVAAHVGGAESYEARCREHLPTAPWRTQPWGGSSTSGTNV
ncbi:thymidine kinase [Cellulosimicrobium arenosum]|uniref:Thymidine kinase n=1 Tax=Cellulosimicrobium arenosum TaxID=2708133 RepID=A0A927J2E2_9MICO|nr:thymidine kinase [Cellulosimicrobium arenosum]MBD8080676.1 thymidine kinase [Cellulosimicrobium arenosum]